MMMTSGYPLFVNVPFRGVQYTKGYIINILAVNSKREEIYMILVL